MELMADVHRPGRPGRSASAELILMEPVGAWVRIVLPDRAVYTVSREAVLDAIGAQDAKQKRAA